jgi:SAM-dependent methyltransferase
MRTDAIALEEKRLEKVQGIEDYLAFHERHRVFPAVFEGRGHSRLMDISAGIGVVGRRIRDFSGAEVVCNEVSPKCLGSLHAAGLETVSFDLDDDTRPYPIADRSFDAVISLATIEHLMHTEHFLAEIRRILSDHGRFYLSAPNYSGLTYLLPFLVSGRTFHDPMNENDRYEFFAHVRYFTYRTMVELVCSRGFVAEAVYVPLPAASTKFVALKKRSPLKAALVRFMFRAVYTVGSPRWAAEPVVCFAKDLGQLRKPIRKVVL